MQKTFRLFLSSTFGDFQAEREALKERVWPQLQAYCASRNASFQVVDLRWGISESDGLAHDTLRICLDEIAHCQRLSPKPNFLMLLGNRYGWRPLPPEIPANEFELVIQEATLKDAQQLLKNWYILDNNALPPHRVLLARGEAHRSYSDWQGIEGDLLRILRASATKLGRTPFRDELYFYSATHQEIVRGSLIVSDADQHVFAFIREIDGLDVKTPLAKNFTDLDRNGLLDTEAQGLRLELREQFIKKLPAEENKLYCKVQWQGQEKSPISTEHIDQLCEYVDKSLRLVIGQELDASSTDKLEQEIAAHQDTARRLAKIFVGRQKQLTQLADAVRISLGHIERTADIPGIVWVNGPGGVGKSAFMARALEDVRNQYPDAVVIQRFIGTTHRSCNLFTFLADLLTEVAKSRENNETLPEGGLQELIEILPQRMSWTTSEQPLIVFIDALDQFNDSFFVRQHIWLPAVLPPHVVVVLSVLDGPMSVTLQNRFPKATGIELAPFNAKEGEVMLDALLLNGGDKKRRLSVSQKKLVLDAFQQDGRPLYLSLAAVECRRWTSWDKPDPFPNQLEELIQRFVTKLQFSHGPVMVDRALAYLSAVRFGISDQEMRDLLWKDPAALAEFKSRKNPDQPEVNSLPTVIWSRIYFDLAPYLVEQGATGAWLYRFYHRVIAEEVTRCHLEGHAAEVHGWIADYFAGQDLHLQDGMRQVPNFRKLAEEPWQRIQAGQLDEAEKVLTDFRFAMAKCEAGLFEELLEDYRLLNEALLDGERAVSETLQVWNAFFRNSAHILRRGNAEWPSHKILLQLAMEHADDSPVTFDAEQWLKVADCDWVWMKRSNRPKFYVPDPCLMIFEGHTSSVNGARLLPDGHVLSWSHNGSLILWDGRNGAAIATFQQHKYEVNGAEFLPKVEGGTDRILSWSGDGTVKVWDLKSGAVHTQLSAPDPTVIGARFLQGNALCPDRIVTWSCYSELRLWDYHDEVEITQLPHDGMVLGASIGPNELILSWSEDTTLRLWKGKDGSQFAVLAQHSDQVNGALFLPQIDSDIERILSWSEDGTLRLWDGNNGNYDRMLLDTGAPVRGVLFLPRIDDVSDQILTWSTDGNLHLWDVKDGTALAVKRQVQMAPVKGAELTPDGRILLWSDKFPLVLWDRITGALQTLMSQQEMQLRGVLALPGNRALSWSQSSFLGLWDLNPKFPSMPPSHRRYFFEGLQRAPDGRILIWSSDKTLILWDFVRNDLPTIFAGHEVPVISAIFLPQLNDGKNRIVSWSNDNTLKIWDTESGSHVDLVGHKRVVKGALLLPGIDGDIDRILSWSADGTLRIWDIKSGRQLAMLSAHNSPITGVLYLPQLNRVLSWSYVTKRSTKVKLVLLWDGQNSVSYSELDGHDFPVQIHLLRDDRVLSSSGDGKVVLWDVQSDREPLVLRGHKRGLGGAELLPDGRWILTWSGDTTLRIWDGSNGDQERLFEGHSGEVKGALFLPGLLGGRDYVLSWSSDKTLRLWDIECRDKTIVLEGHQATVNGAVLTTDGNILSWSVDLSIRLWNPRNSACLDTFAADWVETDGFPGYWQQHAERAGAYFRGTWWVQAIDRRVSIADIATKSKARWQGDGDVKLIDAGNSKICVHDDGELIFLEVWRGSQCLTEARS